MTGQSVPAKIVDAIKNEDGETLRGLFSDNPDHIEFYTPVGSQTWLGYAAQTGKLEAVKILLDIGFDINVGDKRENVKPICSAARGHYDVVKFLIEKGADLDVSLSVRNPLFSAIIGRSPEIVKLLLEAGIDSSVIYNSDTMKNMDAVAFALMRGETESAKIIAAWNTDGSEEQVAKYLRDADKVAKLNAGC